MKENIIITIVCVSFLQWKAGDITKPFVRMHGVVLDPVWLCEDTRVGRRRPRITRARRGSRQIPVRRYRFQWRPGTKTISSDGLTYKTIFTFTRSINFLRSLNPCLNQTLTHRAASYSKYLHIGWWKLANSICINDVCL